MCLFHISSPQWASDVLAWPGWQKWGEGVCPRRSGTSSSASTKSIIVPVEKFDAVPKFSKSIPAWAISAKSFVAKVSGLWHKAVVANVAELGIWICSKSRRQPRKSLQTVWRLRACYGQIQLISSRVPMARKKSSHGLGAERAVQCPRVRSPGVPHRT